MTSRPSKKIDATCSPESIGKLPLIHTRKPDEAWVHPYHSAPSERKKKGFKGVWKSSDDVRLDDSVWKLQQVNLVELGDDVNTSKSFGYWGVNPKIKGVPVHEVQPKDVWFYSPGKKPLPSECRKWTFHCSKLERSWPPPAFLNAPVSPRCSVAKLKIPGAFANEAFPVGRDASKDPKVPSLFTHNLK